VEALGGGRREVIHFRFRSRILLVPEHYGIPLLPRYVELIFPLSVTSGLVDRLRLRRYTAWERNILHVDKAKMDLQFGRKTEVNWFKMAEL